ncbi:MAG: InlB B-repeat-containing protein [Lachnospiraceae bacterium]|nr:InlB B-repeat-containing protein [Lachnospiraceae bacterium]
MKRKERNSKLKQLCAMMTAIIMTLTSVLPVMATNNIPPIDFLELHVGDVLQPGDVIEFPDWAYYHDILYCRYDGTPVPDDGYQHSEKPRGNEDSKYVHVVRAYGGGYCQEDLSADNFAGWRVCNKDICAYGSSDTVYQLVLSPIPKTAVEKVTCSAVLAEGSPEGGAVTLIGFDHLTWQPLKKDASGNLIASPGDVIWAYTTPVEGYISALTAKKGNANLEGQSVHKYCYWEKPYYFQTYDMEKYEFLPEDVEVDVDALSAYTVPYAENVTITGSYEDQGDRKLRIDYAQKVNYQWETVYTESAKVNQVITVSDNTVSGDLSCWENKDYGVYYSKNETFRCKEDTSFIAAVTDETKTVSCNDPCVDLYIENRDDRGMYSKNKHIRPDPGYLTSNSEYCYSIYYLIRVNTAELQDGQNVKRFMITKNDSSFSYDPISGPSICYDDPVALTITPEYMDAPDDLTIDLSSGYRYEKYESDPGTFSYTDVIKDLYTILGEQNDSFDRTNVLPSSSFFWMDFLTEKEGSMVLDLDKNGKPDVFVCLEQYGDDDDDCYVRFERLAGAEECSDDTYTFRGNLQNYGTFTFKLFDRCDVNYYNAAQKICDEQVRKGVSLGSPAAQTQNIAKEGHDLIGWSTVSDNSAGEQTLYDFTAPVTGDTDLYAVWKKQSYAVSFVSDNVTVSSNTVFYDDTVSKPADPVKEGYIFKGWKEDPAADAFYDFSSPVKHALTLQAVWEKKAVNKPDTDQGNKNQNNNQNNTNESGKKTETKSVGDTIKLSSGNSVKVTKTGKNASAALTKVKAKKTVTIPPAVTADGKEYKITAIDKNTFKGKKGIKTVITNKYITAIRANTFKNCKSLKVLKIGNTTSVVTIDKKAFAGIKHKITLRVPKKFLKYYKRMIKKKKLTGKVTLKGY